MNFHYNIFPTLDVSTVDHLYLVQSTRVFEMIIFTNLFDDNKRRDRFVFEMKLCNWCLVVAGNSALIIRIQHDLFLTLITFPCDDSLFQIVHCGNGPPNILFEFQCFWHNSGRKWFTWT